MNSVDERTESLPFVLFLFQPLCQRVESFNKQRLIMFIAPAILLGFFLFFIALTPITNICLWILPIDVNHIIWFNASSFFIWQFWIEVLYPFDSLTTSANFSKRWVENLIFFRNNKNIIQKMYVFLWIFFGWFGWKYLAQNNNPFVDWSPLKCNKVFIFHDVIEKVNRITFCQNTFVRRPMRRKIQLEESTADSQSQKNK